MQELNLVKQLTEDTFDEEVGKSAVPVVVDFYADWCGPCRFVSPILEELASEFQGRVLFTKVDVDRNSTLAARYQVMAIPTILFFREGKLLDTVVGAAQKQHFQKQILKLLDG